MMGSDQNLAAGAGQLLITMVPKGLTRKRRRLEPSGRGPAEGTTSKEVAGFKAKNVDTEIQPAIDSKLPPYICSGRGQFLK